MLPIVIGGLVGTGVTALLHWRKAGPRNAEEATTSERDGDSSRDGRGDGNHSVSPDDLDREQLAQLHAATLKASDSCFELKKLCATVLVPTGALLAVFTNKTLDAAVFGTGTMVIVAFWLADSVGYFYQRRLRVAMTTIWRRRAERCAGGYNHVPTPRPVGPLRAALNASMLYYLILASLLGVGFLLFRMDVIGAIPGGTE